MRLRTSRPGATDAPNRRKSLVALAAVVAVAAFPATAFGQGPDDYQPSEPPQAPGTQGGDPSSPSGSAPTGSGGVAPSTDGSSASSSDSGSDSSSGTATDGSSDPSGEAADTVADGSSGSLEQLPVTGLAVVPVAIAGLLMLLVGAVGRRRYSR